MAEASLKKLLLKMAEKLIYPNCGNYKKQYCGKERARKIANILTLTVNNPHKIMMFDVRKCFSGKNFPSVHLRRLPQSALISLVLRAMCIL